MATLEDAHLRSMGDRWILPASHLQEFESPPDAALRVLRQQLGGPEISLQGPEVFSETYPSVIDPESGTHWDLHFVFRGLVPLDAVPQSSVWRELRFVDRRTVRPADLARGHADILALAGLPVGDAEPR